MKKFFLEKQYGFGELISFGACMAIVALGYFILGLAIGILGGALCITLRAIFEDQT